MPRPRSSPSSPDRGAPHVHVRLLLRHRRRPHRQHPHRGRPHRGRPPHEGGRPRRHRRPALPLRRDQVGGCLLGWLSANGLAVLAGRAPERRRRCSSVSPRASLPRTRPPSRPTRSASSGASCLLVILFLAYLAGGYVAGRMARFDGTRQGVAVWVYRPARRSRCWPLLGLVFGAQFNVLQQLNLPRIPIDEGTATTGGLIALVAGPPGDPSRCRARGQARRPLPPQGRPRRLRRLTNTGPFPLGAAPRRRSGPWSNAGVRSQGPTIRRIDNPDEEGPRRPTGRAARRPAHHHHPHHRPRRLPLDPVGAPGRRAHAAAHPAERTRCRPPGGRHRNGLGHRRRRGGRRLGAAARCSRRDVAAAGRRRGRHSANELPYLSADRFGAVRAGPPHSSPRRVPPSRTGGWRHLGVRPTSRRRGLGAAVLAPVLVRCDAEDTLAAAAVHSWANVRFLRGFGFEVTLEHPDDGRRTPAVGAGASASASLNFFCRPVDWGGASFVQRGSTGPGSAPAPREERMQQYLLTVFQPDGKVPPPERPGAGHARTSTRSPRRCARPASGSSPAACTAEHATVVRGRRRRRPDHRRPVRRGQGAHRRLHDHRGRRPRRRARLGPQAAPRLDALPIEVRAVRGVPCLTAEIERVFREDTAARSRSWSASSATSTSPRRRCRTRSLTAVQRWPADGVPPSPAGWIITTARNRAIDRLRREASRDDRHAQAALLHADDRAGGGGTPCRTTGCG